MDRALEEKIQKMPHEQAARAVEDYCVKQIAYGEGFHEINAERVKAGLKPFATRAALRSFLSWQCRVIDVETEAEPQ